jgi:hypothetical protein
MYHSISFRLTVCSWVVASAILSSTNAYTVFPLATVQPRPQLSLTKSPVKILPTHVSPLFSDASSSEEVNPSSSDDPKGKNKNIISKFFGMFKPQRSDNMSTKEMLAKMGLSTLLSYGWVSNMSYCVTVSLAWFGFTKKTGLSPLAPGQWKPFLAVYAGFYVFNNFIRPIRIAASVGVSKYFDMVINNVQEKTKVPRGVAIGITVFLFNIVGTCSFMALGISIASALSGVPIFPPKA